jgi:hypothetical protein
MVIKKIKWNYLFILPYFFATEMKTNYVNLHILYPPSLPPTHFWKPKTSKITFFLNFEFVFFGETSPV